MGRLFERVIVVFSTVWLGVVVPPCAALAQESAPPAPRPERLEPGLGDEPRGAAEADGEIHDEGGEVGHIRWVEHDGGDDVANGLLQGGGGLAGLGALTLLGVGFAQLGGVFWFTSCLSSETSGGCTPYPFPPAELTWTALAVTGAGLVLATIGLVLTATRGPARETRSPVTLEAGVIRF